LDFGDGPLTSAGSGDIFVAKYSTTGAYQWAKRFGDVEQQYATAVAIDSSGNVVVAGIFLGPSTSVAPICPRTGKIFSSQS
jgi:hypothetical protein